MIPGVGLGWVAGSAAAALLVLGALLLWTAARRNRGTVRVSWDQLRATTLAGRLDRMARQLAEADAASVLTVEDQTALAGLALVLWKDWNPVGADVPEDEYDIYAVGAFRLLKEGAPEAQLASYLASMETGLVRRGSAVAGVKTRAVAARAARLVRSPLLPPPAADS